MSQCPTANKLCSDNHFYQNAMICWHSTTTDKYAARWANVGTVLLEKVHFTPLNNSICPFTPPKQNLGSIYSPNKSNQSNLPPNNISFSCFSAYKLSFKFKFGEWIENMMLYFYIKFFHHYFHKLEIFNTKFITEIKFCMKNIYEKFIYFLAQGIIL